MKYIRNYYKVSAKRGMKVKYKDKKGVIVGSSDCYLKIRLDGECRSFPYHPTWEIEYLED